MQPPTPDIDTRSKARANPLPHTSSRLPLSCRRSISGLSLLQSLVHVIISIREQTQLSCRGWALGDPAFPRSPATVPWYQPVCPTFPDTWPIVFSISAGIRSCPSVYKRQATNVICVTSGEASVFPSQTLESPNSCQSCDSGVTARDSSPRYRVVTFQSNLTRCKDH